MSDGHKMGICRIGEDGQQYIVPLADEFIEQRIAVLEQRATAQSADINKALGDIATLKERVATLEDGLVKIDQALHEALEKQLDALRAARE